MNKQQRRQLTLEKTLLRYTIALEKGDFESIEAILYEAEQDPELERMILEINDLAAAEMDEVAQANDLPVVRELIRTHLPSGLREATPEPPPLTVGHVLARIHADAALRGRVEREALAATKPHQAVDTPLPTDLSLRGVSHLLEQLGVQVGRRFQNLFRETAIFMRMGRNQGVARMAATRRQQQGRSAPPLTPPDTTCSDEASK
jgi:hypothetical protein